MGGHKHVQLTSGRARACQVYPDTLVRATLRGIRREPKHIGILAMVHQAFARVHHHSHCLRARESIHELGVEYARGRQCSTA